MDGSMSVMMGLHRTGFANAQQYDQTTHCSGQRVGYKKDQIIAFGNESCEQRCHCSTEIDGPIVVAVSARPRFGWDQIRNRRADSRPVKIGEESNDKCGTRNQED